MNMIFINRRLLQWKNHLIPPIIAMIYYFFPFESASISEYFRLVFYFFALFFVTMFGYWLNDSFDIELDKKAGKPNFLNGTSIAFRLIGVFIFFLLAIGSWIYTNANLTSTFLFAIEILFFALYTIPGIRLKNHPILGPLLDAHYTHILPVFFTWFLFSNSNTPFLWLFLLFVLLLCKGLRNILLHQILDRKTDLLINLRTFPIIYGPYKTVKIINGIFIPLEIILISLLFYGLSYLTSYPLIFWLVFLFVYFLFFSGWYFFTTSNFRQYSTMFHFFLNDFYEFWLPFLAIWASVLNFQTKIVLSVIQLLIFNQTIYYFQKLIFKIFSNLGIIKNS